MKILVTGSSGFVGRHLMKKCRELGFSPIPVDIKEGIDAGDWNQIRKMGHFDVCVHLAAVVRPKKTMHGEPDCFFDNVRNTLHMSELCRIHKAKMIYVSSYVYGQPLRLPIDETHRVAGVDSYSESKIFGEHICLTYNKLYAFPLIIVRPFNLYGKGQSERFLIPTVIRGAEQGRIVVRDMEPKRDFLHISDFVRLLITCLHHELTGYEIINAGSGKSYSVSDVIDIICSQWNRPVSVMNRNNKREHEIPETLADISKARRILNWRPEVSFEEGIKQLL